MSNFAPRGLIVEIVTRALAEDLGGSGDVTTLADPWVVEKLVDAHKADS